MSIRIRFDITWTFLTREAPEAVFLADAKDILLDDKASDAARFRLTTLSPVRSELRILWDMTLDEDPVSGMGTPDAVISLLHNAFVLSFEDDDPTLDVQAWRKVDFDEVIDHAEISAFYAGETTPDDYPVYRPEPNAGWEEADEVFFQDGMWFWCVSDEMKDTLAPGESSGPAVGPVPEAIYTPWTDAYLLQRQARAAREADLVRLAA